MEARYKDFQSKRFLLDIWSATWDENTTNKIRFFEKCVPANGIHSNRKSTYWGTDQNRAVFVTKAKEEMDQENPTWKHDAEKRKIWSKKNHIAQINQYLKLIPNLKSSKGVNINTIRERLETQKKRETSMVDIAEKSYKAHIQSRQRKIDHKMRQLQKRRKVYVGETTDTKDKFDLAALFNLDIDFSFSEDIYDPPIDLENHAVEYIQNTEENVIKNCFGSDSDEPNEQVNSDKTTRSLISVREERADTESTLTDFNCFSERSSEREECKSCSDWFTANSLTSDDNDYLNEIGSTKEENEREVSYIESEKDSRKDLLKRAVDDIVVVDDEEKEIVLKKLSGSCGMQTCCMDLDNGENIEETIPCLLEHILEMLPKDPHRVNIYYSSLY